ncbi:MULTISPECIES: RHS repeat-associated core domain-containing protein [unclassified Pseudomonas]|uniref:RHS repeat-associated core domain-containing protein n=1 Tax=unclassified Pseudomonas TaxID=196821 RepID=UPI0015A3A4F2|nr:MULTISPECIES: RHS repeat-associated core domain-containing protein [unclassified Pseudomonas]NWB57952.1 RHS domain-containing protein [Pseudomonas sp. F1002]NWC04252.1 RHS domain-containing protein [Pseudomonas sp. G1002]
MSDALWAARMGDALSHTSMMADILGGVLEVAANIAITAVATAAVVAATGITVATGGLGCVLLGAVVGTVVGLLMSKSGADKGLTNLCDSFSNALFPPTVQANILTGATDTLTNNLPAARAAGAISSHVAPAGTELEEPAPEPEASYLDMAESFFSQMWRPTVATPTPGAVPKPLDLVTCMKHPPMPPQFLAEGSDKVTINGQPAVRSGDRSTCDATVVSSGLISSNVTIGGGSVVVREIRSGKTPGVGLAVTALLMLKGGKGKFFSKLPCMLIGGATSMAVSSAMDAMTNAAMGSSNPVHAATGAKVLGGTDELDFVLPAILPIDWQRFYNSRDERPGTLFGTGWSVAYEVCVEIQPHPEGGEALVYTDEQGRPIDMGSIPLGGAVFSPGEGLSVRRHLNGQLLIESDDGLYRLFEPTANPSLLRLIQLGDRNDNRIHLDYDQAGRLVRLRDTFDLVQVELIREHEHVTRVERLFPDQRREVLVSYGYDARANLAEVRDASGQVQRRFTYDAGHRMVEHQLPTGLRCFYEWALIENSEWRVVRHWTDEGDSYQFDYDLKAGLTRIIDGLQRVSTRHWNTQHQIIQYSDKLGQTWLFEWNDERQLLSATDPQGGRYEYKHDDAGNLIGETDPLGRSDSTLWLEHWALPLVETDAAGNSWQYRYDPRGNCVAETDPLGHITRYRYDAHGQVVEIIDASGKSKKLRWNPFGQLVEHIDCSGYPTRFSYDERGYLQVITDALGERTQLSYDLQGRLLSNQLPDGRIELFQRDVSGQLVGYTDPAGHTTLYQHNRRGQISLRTDAHGRQVKFGYDSYGRLQALTNENGERYLFAWDAGDRLTEQQDLDGSAKSYTYNPLDHITTVTATPAPYGNGLGLVPETPPAPIVHQMERDAVGRLIAKTTDDGRTDYAYDPLDQLTAVTFTDLLGNTQALGFAYDALGQMLAEQSSMGTLQHHYDELGNLIQTQIPDGRWLNRLYYGSGHLHQVNLDGQVISDFERDRLHREVLRTQGRLSTRSEYDRSGRLRSRQHRLTGLPSLMPATAQKQFEYDPADNLVGKFDQQSAIQHRQLLHYDATGRIIASQDSLHGQRETFAYDAAANLLDGPQSGAGLVVHNKLLTYQDKRYRYDAFGRMIEKRSAARGLQRFAYDAESRLIEVRNENGSVVRMIYDPLGRRIEKTEHGNDGYPLGETRFTWDGLRLLQEHKHSQTSLYIYEDEGSEPLARVDGTGPLQKIRYYHNDLNGLPEQLTEADGHNVWRATYRVWGNTVEEVREPYYIEEQNLRFQGQYLDRETGLHFNTFRFYDPDVGRFTTPDPIEFDGGINFYQYAPNPISWIDPWGLAPELYYLIAKKDGFYDEMAWGHKKPIGQVYLKKGEVWKVGETVNPNRRYTQKWLKSKNLAYKRVMAAPTKGNMQVWERLKIGKYFKRRGKLPPGNKCRH